MTSSNKWYEWYLQEMLTIKCTFWCSVCFIYYSWYNTGTNSRLWASMSYHAPSPPPRTAEGGLFFSYRCPVFPQKNVPKGKPDYFWIIQVKRPKNLYFSEKSLSIHLTLFDDISDLLFKRSHCGEYYALYFETRISWGYYYRLIIIAIISLFLTVSLKCFRKVFFL